MLFKPKWRWHVLVLITAVLIGLFAGTVLAVGEPDHINSASLNPEYIQYKSEHTGDSVTGYIPPPIDLSFLSGKNIFLKPNQHMAEPLPEKYDLREHNKLTPVKDQNPYGTCWTFAALGSLESCLLPGEANDFSENNMACNHGFVWGPDQGGNNAMAEAYLTRWGGPVNENNDPYGELTKRVGLTPAKHVQNIIIIPPRGSWDDNNNFKQAVINYGAVATSLYFDDNCYNETGSIHSYYYSGQQSWNHAINIVGWDDTYPAANFKTQPSHNGAFLVRNSWGANWGDGGYFWVSYDDVTLGREDDNAVYYNAESVYNYDNIYQYDHLGWINSIGEGTSTFAKGANVFTAVNSQNLEAVGTYIIGSSGDSINIRVYTGVGSLPESGSLKYNQDMTITSPGYYTIKLNAPIALTGGEKFSVVIRYNLPNSGNTYPIPVEIYEQGYADPEANPGESYIGLTDTDNWLDTTTLAGDLDTDKVNVCIKAYTSYAIPVTGVTLTPETMNLIAGGATRTLTATVEPNTAINKNVSWKSSKPEVATVNNGVVTPVGEGQTTITITTVDGGFQDTCEVTVAPPVVGPDLAIALDEYPEEAAAGSKISLKATVLSCGTVDAPKATVEIYIGDTLVCTKSVSKLKWGKSKTLSIKATVPANLPVGTCELKAVVTPVSAIPEINQSNNIETQDINIVLPDLTIYSIVPAGGLIAGKGVNVTVNISNQRNAEAKKFSVKLYLSNDGVTCGQLLGSKKISKLGMKTMAVKLKAKAPKDFNLTDYYIIAVVDEENVVNEETENNNSRVWSSK
ncbi:MAG: lectin like domain-containing protein [Chitinophagales bacterium]